MGVGDRRCQWAADRGQVTVALRSNATRQQGFLAVGVQRIATILTEGWNVREVSEMLSGFGQRVQSQRQWTCAAVEGRHEEAVRLSRYKYEIGLMFSARCPASCE